MNSSSISTVVFISLLFIILVVNMSRQLSYMTVDGFYPAENQSVTDILPYFIGNSYRLPTNWYQILKIDSYNTRPINYLEIGTFYGANVLVAEKTYAAHEGSKLYCIDPWEDYSEYPEYKGQQATTYDTFMKNVRLSGKQGKINIRRGYSNIEVPKFQDEFFDIIYIDGNHEPEYVLEDAVLSFRKLKKGGVMIFDDYGWGGPDMTQKGIDAFLSGYHKRITVLGLVNAQYIIQRKL